MRVVIKPILPVTDLASAVAFYRSIGFDVESYDDAYAWVNEGDGDIMHLRTVDGFDRSTNHTSAYLHVQEADAWHKRVSTGDAAPTEVADMPWGMREFSFTDPDGNLIRVGQNV